MKVVEFATTGLNNDMADLSLIYVSNPIPNPANGQVQFNLSTLETENEINFIIYNSTGQVMHSSQISSNTSILNIDVNNWKPGIYYYKILGTEGESNAKKLVIIQ